MGGSQRADCCADKAIMGERLHQLALQRSEQALASEALQPLTTRWEPCPSLTGGPDFELRTLVSEPPRHLRPAGPKPNPFRPWDPRLQVESIGQHHVLILNKYPVQVGHMLLISRDWAPQTGWLSLLDWRAVHNVQRHSHGLWFFNSGPQAGASQPHRHLQLLPRSNGEELCPRQSWYESRLDSRSVNCHLDVHVSVTRLSGDTADDLASAYRRLSMATGIGSENQASSPRHPYNLLFCDRWMAMIRRRRDMAHGFSLNALGFAGYLLSTEHSDRDWLFREGPDALLEAVIPVETFSGSTDATD